MATTLHNTDARILRGSLTGCYQSGYNQLPGNRPYDEQGAWLYDNGVADGEMDRSNES